VLTQITASSGGLTANRTRASPSSFFSWCITRGLVEQNPVIGTHIAPEQSRERVLPMTELAAVWRACGDDGAYGAIVRMLMLTAQRREEIGGLRWHEVRDDMIVLPGERTKNKRTHIIPLSGPARDIIAAQPRTGEYVFGRQFVSWSHRKQWLDGQLRIAPWTVHDLRRSAATHMAEIGIAPHIIEAILNHVIPTPVDYLPSR
jgi:integrase